jgi:hypothetical protein
VAENIFFAMTRTVLGPTRLLFGGYWEPISQGVKSHGADYSPPFIAEVKYAYSYASSPSYDVMYN